MNLQKLQIIVFSLIFSYQLSAQNINDVVRYSESEWTGTARSIGAGNAMSSLGGDMGIVPINPAALAMFRWEEYQLTLAYSDQDINSSFIGQSNPLKKSKANFNPYSASYLQTMNPYNKDWTQLNYAISYNRLKNLNQHIGIEGTHMGSILDRAIESSNGFDPDNLDNFLGGPAYDAQLTIYDEDTGNYDSDVPFGSTMNVEHSNKSNGGINELSLAVAGNYKEKLLLGASISLPFINYTNTYEHIERLSGNEIFNSLKYEQSLETTGSGINLKVGATYKIDHKLNMSLAFHSPSWYNLFDEYYADMTYNYNYNPADGIFDGPGPAIGESPLGEFEYRFRSPYRAIGGLSYIFKKRGFISADAEYTNYKSARFNFEDDDIYQKELNDEIESTLGSGLDIRLGGEFVIKKFRLRGGYNWKQSPYADDNKFYAESWSGGLGFRSKVFIDLAYKQTMKDEVYLPYSVSNALNPTTNVNTKVGSVVLTFGVKI